MLSTSLVDVEVHVEEALSCGHSLAHEGTLTADTFSLSGVTVSHLSGRQHGRLVPLRWRLVHAARLVLVLLHALPVQHVRGVSQDWLVLLVADHVSLRHGLVDVWVNQGLLLIVAVTVAGVVKRLDGVAMVLALAVTLVLIEGRVTQVGLGLLSDVT